jgi:hypothetical protein
MSLSPELRDKILSTASRQPAPTRAQATRARLWLFAAGIVGALAIFLLSGGSRLTDRPPTLMALTSLGTATFSGLGMYVLFTRRGRSALRRPAVWLVLAALGAIVGFLLFKYSVSAAYGQTRVWPDRVGLRCLRLGILTGALPLFAALAAWRRTDPLTPVATGAAFGAGAGLGSAVLVDLWCPVAYIPHLLLGHVLPIVILAFTGGLLGWWVLRLRRR